MRLAIYGKLRAGKTALASYYAEKLNCDIVDFSDAMKEAIKIIFPEEFKEEVKNRELLIKFGQHMRKLDEDVWTNIVKNKILNNKDKNIIVTGVRQQNEYDMLKKLGFKFIKVEASEHSRAYRSILNKDVFNSENLTHSTETILDNFEYDFLIENNYGFKELHIAANNVLKEIQ